MQLYSTVVTVLYNRDHEGLHLLTEKYWPETSLTILLCATLAASRLGIIKHKNAIQYDVRKTK